METPATSSANMPAPPPAAAPRTRGAILAAGLGRRLEPLTARYIPKPLFPLGGKVSMAETWVRKLAAAGVSDITMNLCVGRDAIRAHFQNRDFGRVPIGFVEEETPSGTLGGVCKQALGRDARLLDGESPPNIEPFTGSTLIVPSGDIVTNLDAPLLAELLEIHRRAGAACTMALVPVPRERIKDYGTAELDAPQPRSGPLAGEGRIIRFHEKDPNSPSNLNNASVYFLETRFLRELDQLRTPARHGIPAPFYDFGKHVFPALLGQLPHVRLAGDNVLWGVQYDGEWFDVGQKRDYLRVNEFVLDGRIAIELPYEKQPWGYLGSDVEIAWNRVEIMPPVVIGHGCRIAPGARLGPYAVLGDGWTIGPQARLAHCVLWESYPLATSTGRRLTSQQMRLLDPHEIAASIEIESSIIAGGRIDRDLRDCTVTLEDDGQLTCLPLDYIPDGPRL
jgi:NDP-sugar pyrophosphorylase family protein